MTHRDAERRPLVRRSTLLFLAALLIALGGMALVAADVTPWGGVIIGIALGVAHTSGRREARGR
jgi:hypothetical protein